MAKKGNPNIAEAGRATRWPKGFRPPGAGQRPRRFDRFCKGEKLSRYDVQEIATWILSLTQDQMQAELKKPNQTIFILGLLNAIINDLKYRKRDTLEMLINRTAGLPSQSVDVRQTGSSSVTIYTPEQRRQRIAELAAKWRADERKTETTNSGDSGETRPDPDKV